MPDPISPTTEEIVARRLLAPITTGLGVSNPADGPAAQFTPEQGRFVEAAIAKAITNILRDPTRAAALFAEPDAAKRATTIMTEARRDPAVAEVITGVPPLGGTFSRLQASLTAHPNIMATITAGVREEIARPAATSLTGEAAAVSEPFAEMARAISAQLERHVDVDKKNDPAMHAALKKLEEAALRVAGTLATDKGPRGTAFLAASAAEKARLIAEALKNDEEAKAAVRVIKPDDRGSLLNRVVQDAKLAETLEGRDQEIKDAAAKAPAIALVNATFKPLADGIGSKLDEAFFATMTAKPDLALAARYPAIRRELQDAVQKAAAECAKDRRFLDLTPDKMAEEIIKKMNESERNTDLVRQIAGGDATKAGTLWDDLQRNIQTSITTPANGVAANIAKIKENLDKAQEVLVKAAFEKIGNQTAASLGSNRLISLARATAVPPITDDEFKTMGEKLSKAMAEAGTKLGKDKAFLGLDPAEQARKIMEEAQKDSAAQEALNRLAGGNPARIAALAQAARDALKDTLTRNNAQIKSLATDNPIPITDPAPGQPTPPQNRTGIAAIDHTINKNEEIIKVLESVQKLKSGLATGEEAARLMEGIRASMSRLGLTTESQQRAAMAWAARQTPEALENQKTYLKACNAVNEAYGHYLKDAQEKGITPKSPADFLREAGIRPTRNRVTGLYELAPTQENIAKLQELAANINGQRADVSGLTTPETEAKKDAFGDLAEHVIAKLQSAFPGKNGAEYDKDKDDISRAVIDVTARLARTDAFRNETDPGKQAKMIVDALKLDSRALAAVQHLGGNAAGIRDAWNAIADSLKTDLGKDETKRHIADYLSGATTRSSGGTDMGAATRALQAGDAAGDLSTQLRTDGIDASHGDRRVLQEAMARALAKLTTGPDKVAGFAEMTAEQKAAKMLELMKVDPAAKAVVERLARVAGTIDPTKLADMWKSIEKAAATTLGKDSVRDQINSMTQQSLLGSDNSLASRAIEVIQALTPVANKLLDTMPGVSGPDKDALKAKMLETAAAMLQNPERMRDFAQGNPRRRAEMLIDAVKDTAEFKKIFPNPAAVMAATTALENALKDPVASAAINRAVNPDRTPDPSATRTFEVKADVRFTDKDGRPQTLKMGTILTVDGTGKITDFNATTDEARKAAEAFQQLPDAARQAIFRNHQASIIVRPNNSGPGGTPMANNVAKDVGDGIDIRASKNAKAAPTYAKDKETVQKATKDAIEKVVKEKDFSTLSTQDQADRIIGELTKKDGVNEAMGRITEGSPVAAAIALQNAKQVIKDSLEKPGVQDKIKGLAPKPPEEKSTPTPPEDKDKPKPPEDKDKPVDPAAVGKDVAKNVNTALDKALEAKATKPSESKIYVLVGNDDTKAMTDSVKAWEDRNKVKGDVVIIRAKKDQSIADAVKDMKGGNVILLAHGGPEGTFGWNKNESLSYTKLLESLPKQGVDSVTIGSCYGGSAVENHILEKAPAGTLVQSMVGRKSEGYSFDEAEVTVLEKVTPLAIMLKSLDNVDPVEFARQGKTWNKTKVIEQEIDKEGKSVDKKDKDGNPVYKKDTAGNDVYKYTGLNEDPSNVLPHTIGLGGKPPVIVDLKEETKKISDNFKKDSFDKASFTRAVADVKAHFDNSQWKDDKGFNITPAQLTEKIDAVVKKLQDGKPPTSEFSLEEHRIAYALSIAKLYESGEMDKMKAQARANEPDRKALADAIETATKNGVKSDALKDDPDVKAAVAKVTNGDPAAKDAVEKAFADYKPPVDKSSPPPLAAPTVDKSSPPPLAAPTVEKGSKGAASPIDPEVKQIANMNMLEKAIAGGKALELAARADEFVKHPDKLFSDPVKAMALAKDLQANRNNPYLQKGVKDKVEAFVKDITDKVKLEEVKPLKAVDPAEVAEAIAKDINKKLDDRAKDKSNEEKPTKDAKDAKDPLETAMKEAVEKLTVKDSKEKKDFDKLSPQDQMKVVLKLLKDSKAVQEAIKTAAGKDTAVTLTVSAPKAPEAQEKKKPEGPPSGDPPPDKAKAKGGASPVAKGEVAAGTAAGNEVPGTQGMVQLKVEKVKDNDIVASGLRTSNVTQSTTKNV